MNSKPQVEAQAQKEIHAPKQSVYELLKRNNIDLDKPLRTNDGDKVRIIAIEPDNLYPLVAEITEEVPPTKELPLGDTLTRLARFDAYGTYRSLSLNAVQKHSIEPNTFSYKTLEPFAFFGDDSFGRLLGMLLGQAELTREGIAADVLAKADHPSRWPLPPMADESRSPAPFTRPAPEPLKAGPHAAENALDRIAQLIGRPVPEWVRTRFDLLERMGYKHMIVTPHSSDAKWQIVGSNG